jgi:hypothetical protein
MIGRYRDKPDEDVATKVSGVGRHAAEASGAATGSVETRRSGGSGRHAINRVRSVRGWFIATVSSVAGIAGLSLWLGPAPIVGPWDVFTLLNGGYRIYEGQAPSTDFSNPIGPLVYGLTSLGMHLQHSPSLAAVTYGQVIFLVIASALAWMVTWKRLPAMYAAAFTVFVAFLAVSVRPLGYSPSTTTYAMLYNRDGWLLYSILLLLVLLGRREPPTKRSRVVDGLLMGLILGLLFYDKITFFLAGLVAVGLGLALSAVPRSPRLGAAALAGFAAVGVVMQVAFGLHSTAYIKDLLTAAEVQAAGQRTGMLAHTIFWIAPVAVLSVLLVGGLLVTTRRRGEPTRGIVYLSLATAYVLGSSVLISAGDASEKGELPTLVVIPLLLVAFLEPKLPRWAGGSSTDRGGTWPVPWSRLLLIGLALLMVGSAGRIAGEDSLGLAKAISYRGYDARPPATQQFSADSLRDFVIPADTQYQTAYRTANALPAMIDNGLSLLRQNIRPGDTVFTLAYTDPFSMALGLPLSHCGPLWWDLGYDFDQTHHPTAECAIGTANWVIIPRMVPNQGCCQETVSVMLSIYSDYLSQHYKNVQQTSDWILLRRTH